MDVAGDDFLNDLMASAKPTWKSRRLEERIDLQDSLSYYHKRVCEIRLK